MNRIIAPLAVIVALTIGAVSASATPKSTPSPDFFTVQLPPDNQA